MESGPKLKIGEKKFMIFGPKERGGGRFLTPPPPNLPQNLKKMGFKWGRSGGGGVRTKNSLGDVFIGQNNDFTWG